MGTGVDHELDDLAVAENDCIAVAKCDCADEDVNTTLESQERLPYRGGLLCIL